MTQNQKMLFRQATQALTIEYFDLVEALGVEKTRDVFLKVVLNCAVDNRFSSDEYNDLQDERLTKLAGIILTLIMMFENDPQSFTGKKERFSFHKNNLPILSVAFDGIEQCFGEELECIYFE